MRLQEKLDAELIFPTLQAKKAVIKSILGDIGKIYRPESHVDKVKSERLDCN